MVLIVHGHNDNQSIQSISHYQDKFERETDRAVNNITM